MNVTHSKKFMMFEIICNNNQSNAYHMLHHSSTETWKYIDIKKFLINIDPKSIERNGI